MNAQDHANLARLFDWPGGYEGYKPDVREAPNGDTKACPAPGCANGNQYDEQGYPSICNTCAGAGLVPNVDAGPAGKRYLHVALKYNPPAWAVEYLARAHFEACRVAEALGVPDAFYPRVENGTLRVLEYPSAGHRYCAACDRKTIVKGCRFACSSCGWTYDGESWPPTHRPCLACRALWSKDARDEVCPALAPGTGTAEHTDFDLFTIVLWRSTPADLEIGRAAKGNMMGHSLSGFGGGPTDIPSCVHCGEVAPESGSTCYGESARDIRKEAPNLRAARELSPGLHIGELGALVGLGPATPHRVPARPYVQKSLIYFAMPANAARLPTGKAELMWHDFGGDTVAEWVAERTARSRVKGYT